MDTTEAAGKKKILKNLIKRQIWKDNIRPMNNAPMLS